MNEIYVKSGKIGSIWLYGPISGIVLIPILSYLYALSISYFSMSLIGAAIKIFIFCVFAMFLAIVQTGTAQLSKCRNNRVKLLFYIVTTVLAFYLSWVFCIFYNLYGSFNLDAILGLILNPNELFVNFKTIFNSSPGWNTFYWIVELIGFVLVSLISHFSLKEHVFCEDCNKWTTEKDFKLHLGFENIEQLQEIAERNVNKLLDLPIAVNLDQNHIIVNFHACESCMNSNTLNFDLVKCTTSNGKVSKVKDDFSPVIFISSPQIEAFNNKSQHASNKFEQENTPDVEIEYIEPIKTTLVESIFFNSKWRLIMGITSLLLIPTYVIEPFLGLTSTIETCASNEEYTETRKDGYETYKEFYYKIDLVHGIKESSVRPLNVPKFVGDKIKIGDKINVFHSKWRKEIVEIQLEDGLKYPVKQPYGMFIVMPIIHIISCLILFGSFNNPPSQNDKNQKTKRIQLFIMNFFFSVMVLFSFYISSKMFF